MDVTDHDIANVRQISEDLFGNNQYIELVEVKEAGGSVMVRVETANGVDILGARNAFAKTHLERYHRDGYVATSVGGDDDRHTAWFVRADEVVFGDAGPRDEYDLSDGWKAVVGDSYVVVHHNDSVVAHVRREGWTLDEYTFEAVLPSKVTTDLRKIGFEAGDIGTPY